MRGRDRQRHEVRRNTRNAVLGTAVAVVVFGGAIVLATVLPTKHGADALPMGGPAITIDLASLPTRLPAAVAAKERAVVTVNVQLRTRHMTLRSTADPSSWGVGGSGVVLAHHLVASAGHIFAPPSLNVDGGPAVCRWTTIDGSTRKPRGFFANHEPVFGTVHGVTHIEFSLGTEPSPLIPDMSVLHVAGTGLEHLPTIPIAKHAPAAGSRLYFVNYQSAPGNLDRDPFTGVLSKAAFLAGRSYPVMFSGFALGTQGNKLNVIDNLRSYGVSNEALLRPGGSGGAVLNERGQLVGISIASARTPGNEWQADYDQTFTHIPAGYSPAVSEVQLVTGRRLRAMETLTIATGHC